MSAPNAPSKRERAARALDATRLGTLLRALGTWRGALVLTHHRIGDAAACALDRSVFSAGEETLAAQVALLARSCELVTADDLARGGLDRPGRRMLLTFDDGYRDNHDRALPILAAHGVRATFFLTSGFIDGSASPWWDEIAWMVRRATAPEVRLDRWLEAPVAVAPPATERAIGVLVARYKRLGPADAARFLDAIATQTHSGRRPRGDARADFMTWEQARGLRDAGMALGGHTASHPVLRMLAPAAQRAEIENGLGRMHEELGERPATLAYPVGGAGHYDATTIGAASASGVRLAFANHGGHAWRGYPQPLDVPRLNVDASLSPALLRATIALPALFARPSGGATYDRRDARRDR